jgi:hypothetical protein
VIQLNTYHLFIIKPDAFQLYFKNANPLFLLLKKLYRMDKRNANYGLSLYHQVCTTMNVKLLSNYMIEKVPAIKVKKNTFKMLSFFESTTFELHYSNILVETDKTLPAIYQIFHIYHNHIFVCDFKQNRYFWLDEVLKNGNHRKKTHIIN